MKEKENVPVALHNSVSWAAFSHFVVRRTFGSCPIAQ